MDLSSKTIGSPRTFEEAKRAERRARIANALMLFWLAIVVAAIPFAAGASFGAWAAAL